MDPGDPARNKADSLVWNMTHLGNNLNPVANQYSWPKTELTSSAAAKRGECQGGRHLHDGGFSLNAAVSKRLVSRDKKNGITVQSVKALATNHFHGKKG